MSFERIAFFSDAVFAIAITLLVLAIRPPQAAREVADEQLIQYLLSLGHEILGYVIGFSVIGTYWVAHHSLFDCIQDYDRTLIWLNMLFLLFIAISPFPTAIVSEYEFSRSAQIFFAMTVVMTGVAKIALWLYASHHHRLIPATMTDQEIRRTTWRSVLTPLAFFLSIPFALLGPTFPIIIWAITPLLHLLVGRRT